MRELHFVCTDFPGPGSECVFVECEDGEGHGVHAGEWVRRPDGLVALVVKADPAPSLNPDAGHVVAMLTGLPVVLNGVLPEGSIFMHPRTFRGLPPERPSWLDRMRAEADAKAKAAPPLDGDGRDGDNGSGPFEG